MPGPIPGYPDSLQPHVAAVLLESFLYGLYVILFSVSVLTLRRKVHQWPLLSMSLAMFVLATADIGFTIGVLFVKQFKQNLKLDDLRPRYFLCVTNNTIANLLTFYRCCHIWRMQKSIVAGTCIFLILTTICGYTTISLVQYVWVSVLINMIFNVVTTGLTAGRLWWLIRVSRAMLGEAVITQYKNAAYFILESGILYTIYVLFALASQRLTYVNVMLDTGLVQIFGMIPTWMTVHSAFKKSMTSECMFSQQ
ncbi:hypothetical protein H2248_003577 [Termitomyces sp. 'cryptogamus']|nr:hypothetical protein H2248_003577 [Termitomyces sp. 'cryptogamus']